MTVFTLANIRRTGIDRHHQIGRRVRKALKRIYRVIAVVVVPAVLANLKTDLCVVDAQHARDIGPRFEMTHLVENTVSRQQLLGVAQHDSPIPEHQQPVMQRLARPLAPQRRADDPVQLRVLARRFQQRHQARIDATQKRRFVE